jgi:hypothetical protein
MSKCKGHFFHAECLKNQLGDSAFLVCAFCKQFYGILTGDQPKGTMNIRLDQMKVSGYEGNS